MPVRTALFQGDPLSPSGSPFPYEQTSLMPASNRAGTDPSPEQPRTRCDRSLEPTVGVNAPCGPSGVA